MVFEDVTNNFWARGDGAGNLYDAVKTFHDGTHYISCYYDADNDGDYDMYGCVSIRGEPAQIYRIENTGTSEKPKFGDVAPVKISLGVGDTLSYSRMQAAVRDLDGDGDGDFIIQHRIFHLSHTNFYLNYYENIGNDSIKHREIIDTLEMGSRCTFADLNNDSIVDLLIMGYYGKAHVKWGLPEIVKIDNILDNHQQSNKKITLKKKNLILSENLIGNTSLKIFDLRGKLIANIALSTMSIDLGKYVMGNGVYLAQVISKSGLPIFQNLISIK